MILRHFPPMGAYETLFKFADATGQYMGDGGTHPWAQGYPLTIQIPGGPPLPGSLELGPAEVKYPKATGEPELLAAITDYYNHFYDAGITTDNVAVFAGGRPAGILPGWLCDMARSPERSSGLETFARFSFGPLPAESYDGDMAILAQCVAPMR